MLSHQSPPNSHTFPSLIKAASSSPFLASNIGIAIHTQVIKRGLSFDPFIQASFINLYTQIRKLFDARKMFNEITQPCIVSYNSMLDAYGKNGDMVSALLLFKRMSKRDIYSWTSIINGFGRNGCFKEAIQIFEKMMEDNYFTGFFVKPNEATFVSVLSSCANLDGGKGLYHGKKIHGYIIKNEIELTIFMGTALISFYGKTGCLGSAVKVFRKMEVRAVCSYNAIISSLASNGREKQAVDFFEKMKLEGFHPNGVTFVAALSACARSGLVHVGLNLFESMANTYGVVPRMEHYGCVVDLLGRAGLLREATEFIKRMKFGPDATVLGALLGACKVHGAVELANEVGMILLDLQPSHCGRYVVLSNIYAEAERWGRAADLRKTMVDAGITKIPAYSCIRTP